MSKLEVTPSGAFVPPPLQQLNVQGQEGPAQIVNPDEIKNDPPEDLDPNNPEIKSYIQFTDSEEQESKILSKTSIIPESPLRSFLIQYRGIGLGILSSICISFSGFTVKYLISQGYKASYCLLWRCPGLLVFSTVEMLYKRVLKKEKIFDSISPCSENDRRKTFLILILAMMILGPLMMLCQFYSFNYIELADSQTIVYSNSVFVTFFAHFILHESMGIVPMVVSLVTIAGVIIISKPSFITGKEPKADSEYGILLAVAAMFFNTFVYVTMRMLSNVNSSISLFVLAISTVALGLGLTFAEDSFEIPRELIHTVAFIISLVSFTLGTAAMTIAIQYEEAGVLSLVRCLDVVLSFIWQMIIKTYPDNFSLGGAALVISSIVIVFFRKYLKKLPPDDKLAKSCACLMR